jgi:hypothetical protein
MKTFLLWCFVIFTTVSVNSQTYPSFEDVLRQRGINLNEVCKPDNLVNMKILEEYGAYFVAKDIVPPPTCIFDNEGGVNDFLASSLNGKTKVVKIADKSFEFQSAAADSLVNEVFPALSRLNPKILPYQIPRRYSDVGDKEILNLTANTFVIINADWAKRTYCNTLVNWKSRLDKMPDKKLLKDLTLDLDDLTDSIKKKRINLTIGEELKTANQKRKSTSTYYGSRKNPIMRSVAIPGASQHLLLIAFDLEIINADIIETLNNAGWYQTVPNDDRHFTYLGYKTEEDLKKNGLKRVECKKSEYKFWIPNIKSFQFHQYTNWECN